MAYGLVWEIFGKRAVPGERVTHYPTGVSGTIDKELFGHLGSVMVMVDGMVFAMPFNPNELDFHGRERK